MIGVTTLSFVLSLSKGDCADPSSAVSMPFDYAQDERMLVLDCFLREGARA